MNRLRMVKNDLLRILWNLSGEAAPALYVSGAGSEGGKWVIYRIGIFYM